MALSKEANERLWDALIKEALIENANRELDELSNDTGSHEFSKQFEKKIRKLYSKIARSENIKDVGKIFGRCAVAAAAVMGIAFGGFLTQPEVYAAVENVVRNIFDSHDSYTYQGYQTETVFDDTKKLGYIPDGYELRSVYYMGNAMLLTYESENEEYIYFQYSFAEGSSITVDNEEHDYKEININGKTYYYYNSSSNDFNSIIWYNGNYAYSIDAQLSKKELVKIAENIIN